MKRLFTFVIVCFLTATMCDNASAAKRDKDVKTDKLTVGKVQREIRIGMPSSEVIEALGSPNMVSTDEQRREVWVYDKTATDVRYSNSGGGVWLIFAGVGGESGSSSRSQRTLTIVVKFDNDGKVRDFAYHSSTF